MTSPLMILVAGPYRSGTNDDPVLIARNADAMTAMALRLFRAGHLPVMGEWFALPLIEHGGSKKIGDPVFDGAQHRRIHRSATTLARAFRLGQGVTGSPR